MANELFLTFFPSNVCPLFYYQDNHFRCRWSHWPAGNLWVWFGRLLSRWAAFLEDWTNDKQLVLIFKKKKGSISVWTLAPFLPPSVSVSGHWLPPFVSPSSKEIKINHSNQWKTESNNEIQCRLANQLRNQNSQENNLKQKGLAS